MVIREAKQMYYNQLLIHADKKMKTTWSIVKRETGKKSVSLNVC